MKWHTSVFIDSALPFGLQSAPKVTTALADTMEWVVRQEGIEWIMHYLDDFLVMGAPGTEDCAMAVRNTPEVLGT